MRVLLIEDHDEVSDLVVRALSKDGHRVSVAKSIREADSLMDESEYDAAVLDIGLPDGDGIETCRRLRGNGVTFPILVLTAQSAVATRVSGLDAGADDFLAKPFAVAELRARIRSLGRRGPLLNKSEHRFGDVHLDFSTRRAYVASDEVPLTSREWRILELLVARAGRVVSRTEILERLVGEASAGGAASLEVVVGRIRKKLGAGIIRTIRGEGYAAG